MPECAESEGPMTDIGLVREHHFHDPDVANDRSADRGDEQEDGGDENERCADDVEPAKHDCGVVEIVCWAGEGVTATDSEVKGDVGSSKTCKGM